jgi:uncharacterized protein (DUF2147 family)
MKILIVLLSLFTIFQNLPEHSIIGTWNTLEDNTSIQIIEQKGILFGRIKASDNTKAQVGRLILKDLVKSGNSWTGKIFAVKKNQWYDVEITSEKNSLNLKIQIGFLHKNLKWEKS